jgi:hypothetical protein
VTHLFIGFHSQITIQTGLILLRLIPTLSLSLLSLSLSRRGRDDGFITDGYPDRVVLGLGDGDQERPERELGLHLALVVARRDQQAHVQLPRRVALVVLAAVALEPDQEHVVVRQDLQLLLFRRPINEEPQVDPVRVLRNRPVIA